MIDRPGGKEAAIVGQGGLEHTLWVPQRRAKPTLGEPIPDFHGRPLTGVFFRLQQLHGRIFGDIVRGRVQILTVDRHRDPTSSLRDYFPTPRHIARSWVEDSLERQVPDSDMVVGAGHQPAAVRA